MYSKTSLERTFRDRPKTSVKTPITTAIQEATRNMQVANLQAATSKLQQNISQLPEKRQRGRSWALSPICQSPKCLKDIK